MKPGKYDPPGKERIYKENLSVCYLWQVLTPPPKPQFTPFPNREDDASCARAEETSNFQNQPTNQQSNNQIMKGRKPVVTTERISIISKAISEGDTERLACLKAGIGLTAWNVAKRGNPELRNKIQASKTAWKELEYKRLQIARYETQHFRLAGKKAKRPQPTHQASMVRWHLTFRVPLNYGAIPENEIKAACERFNYTVQQWQAQANAFGLWHKIYSKRAKLRGDELLQQSPSVVRYAPLPEDFSSGSEYDLGC